MRHDFHFNFNSLFPYSIETYLLNLSTRFVANCKPPSHALYDRSSECYYYNVKDGFSPFSETLDFKRRFFRFIRVIMSGTPHKIKT